MKLKEKLFLLQRQIDDDISRLEKEMKNQYADIKVITTKLNCLESFKREINEICSICDERNRY